MATKYLRVAMVTLFFIFAAAGAGWTASGYPTKPIELVAAGDPGGGLDIHARIIDQATMAEKLQDKPFTISNKGGGGGNLATSYMATQKGSAYHLAINSNRVLLNPLLGTTQYGLKDMVPVARLTAEYEVWAVRADSKYKTAAEVIADLRKDPRSVVFGVGTIPSDDQFNILLPAQKSGVDITKLKIVAFKSGGDLMGQLVGGHVPIISTSTSEIMAQVQAGKVRLLTVSSPNRMDVAPTVPTWKDAGIDLTLFHWRGIFGPPNMPKEAYDYWNKKFAAMVKTKTWKDLMAKNELLDAFLPGDEFRKELERDNETFRSLLGSLGMLKK